jgi:hypothetical protein
MHNGTFVYRNYLGEDRRLRVRDCPNPSLARETLEKHVLDSPVRWEASKS